MRQTLVICFLAFASIGDASAFRINPINRDNAAVPTKSKFLDSISEPVHESITRQARELYWARCSKEPSYNPGCEAPQPPERTIQDSLIRGVWWSDDPNQDLYKGRQVVWITHMKDAKRRAKNPKYKIDGKYMMQYRSHYGDMQFLHSMASADGEAAAQTKQKIYMWGAFVYQVATKKVGRSTKFRDVPVNGLLEHFERQSNWQLPLILRPRYLLRDNPNDFSDHALGILLHMVQDSYSAAHVERVYTSTEHCPSGYIKSFHSYTHQVPSKHDKADSFAGYNESHFPAGAGPVDVGAQLIWFARHRADWTTEVIPYLDKTVYCFEGIPDEAGPGEY